MVKDLPICKDFENRIPWIRHRKFKKAEVIRVPVLDLKVQLKTKSGPKHWHITESPAYWYLQGGNEERYDDYYNWVQAKWPKHKRNNTERFEELFESIRKYGYREDCLIVVFDKPKLVIRDGQNRATIIYHLCGNIEIPVLEITR